MNKSRLLMVFLGIGVFVVVLYIVSNKNGIQTKGESLKISNYIVTLPEDWQKGQTTTSVIDNQFAVEGYCITEATSNPELPACSFNIVKDKTSDMEVVFFDTDKAPLGGGGFISTVVEKETLGTAPFAGSFNFAWRAVYEGEMSEKLAKALDKDGNPLVYYIFGCVTPEKDLCVLFRGGDDPFVSNFSKVEKFRDLVNQLEVKKLGN